MILEEPHNLDSILETKLYPSFFNTYFRDTARLSEENFPWRSYEGIMNKNYIFIEAFDF